jgi:hypothetical protein
MRTGGGWDDDWKESPPGQRTYGDAESAADMATYRRLKPWVAVRAALVAGAAALAILIWSPFGALALALGALCGIGNMYLAMYGNERLAGRGNVGVFVLSSLLRIGVFGIVAAALAIHGPTWSLGPFFGGFFLPLALYAISAPRAFDRK